MSYTKETLEIKNPSPKLLAWLQKQKEAKLRAIEKLRSMKPEDFDCCVRL